jgi:hypothetical protein
MRGMVSLDRNTFKLYFNIRTSEIWPDKRCGMNLCCRKKEDHDSNGSAA